MDTELVSHPQLHSHLHCCGLS
uniref:Uncharacterized protein n=1 Tax=Arundo donax TaxID=35708 RepID=A0A0A8Z7X3_ARUDO